jgi:Ca2+/Na+ antiporter
LARPCLWQDKFEHFIFKCKEVYGIRTNANIGISNLADQYYAQCWTVVEESSMQWQVNKPHSNSRNDNVGDDENGEGIRNFTVSRSLILVAAGLAGLIFGGRIFVNAATELAKMFGVSDKFIAVTIMAAGTSMPELATSVVAAVKGRGQLALGNVLGSNISNILLILGGAALINPISFSGMTIVDLGVIVFGAFFIFACAFLFRKKEIDRFEGLIFLIAQIAYMWYLIAHL